LKKTEDYPASQKTARIAGWEDQQFGAFVHFNDNTFIGKEISRNSELQVFNPPELDFKGMMETFKNAGIRYAVLTARHTSGFCLWDSKVSDFDVAGSPFGKDVVKLFVDACRESNIRPCIYYCLWGNKDWNLAVWNPMIKKETEDRSPAEIIKLQLGELAGNYGDIYEFWLDMYCWCDTSLSVGEIYQHIRSISPGAIIHFNQQVQDGSEIRYFPTDILNGEERLPPIGGHSPRRRVNGKSYYLPFEYEITSQRCDSISLGHGLMKGSVWFTYPGSQFYPVDSLYNYIRQSFDRGGNCILISTAPDKSGSYRKEDRDSLIKLGKMIRN
jgi:alpha-L-fucosidase